MGTSVSPYNLVCSLYGKPFNGYMAGAYTRSYLH